jgi:hypothetical protein
VGLVAVWIMTSRASKAREPTTEFRAHRASDRPTRQDQALSLTSPADCQLRRHYRRRRAWRRAWMLCPGLPGSNPCFTSKMPHAAL